jgi:tripartite-type tricarboxylate transporter receptor subunit TctC
MVSAKRFAIGCGALRRPADGRRSSGADAIEFKIDVSRAPFDHAVACPRHLDPVVCLPSGSRLKALEGTMFKRWLGAIAATMILLPIGVRAEEPADFYRGKQVSLIVGYGPGGGYDIYARVVAQFLGKHIPGNPSVVVQNMPGAGSLRAANYIYAGAPKDGTVIGTFGRDIPLLGVMGGNSAVQFDPAKFTWLGSPSSYANDAYLLWVRDDAADKTVADAQRPGGPPLVIGGTGEGSTGNDISILLRDALNLNLKLVSGYPDSTSESLAVERKEVDGHFLGLSATYTERPDWLKPGNGIHAMLQFARRTRHPLFPDVPTAEELAKTDRARALIELAELPYTLSRPFVAPPGLPDDRAKALQSAFLDMQKDPDYLAQAAKLKIDVSPIGGADSLALIERLSQASPDLLDYMRKLHANSKGD